MGKANQKIVYHLWFDKEAKEAAKFYTSIFKGSKIKNIAKIYNTPSGEVDVVSFEILEHKFMAISAGPLFKFNPSTSFILNFDQSKDKHSRENLDIIWGKLSQNGKILMPLQKYPFSERYGWIQDKYGVSWQIVPSEMGEMMQKGTKKQIASVTQAFLKMKKFDLAELKKAYKGK